METFIEYAKRKKRIPPRKLTPKDIGRKGKLHFNVVDWTWMYQEGNKEKVLIIERIEFEKLEGERSNKIARLPDKEYRLGYCIVGKNGHLKNKWCWGQFSPHVGIGELGKLIAQAIDEGTILQEDIDHLSNALSGS
jgi:hypothetical protein